MKCNVGERDRALRIVIGAAIICIGFYYRSLWALIGLIPLITGVIGWCGIYRLLGISTCSTKSDK